MNPDWVQIIIQGGSVGVAVMAVWSLFKIVSNHIEHNTEATKNLTSAITELVTYLRTINDR